MTISDVIRDWLAGDETLAVLLVGGVYTFAQIGRAGISRITTPDAYESGGFLQPCAVIKAGERRAAEPVRDEQAGSRQAVAVYLYDDGENGCDALNAARDRVVALLDRQWIAGAGYLRCVGGADDERDPKLNGAAVVRVDFDLIPLTSSP